MNGIFRMLSPAGEALNQGMALAGEGKTGMSNSGKGSCISSLASFESLFRLFMKGDPGGSENGSTEASPQVPPPGGVSVSGDAVPFSQGCPTAGTSGQAEKGLLESLQEQVTVPEQPDEEESVEQQTVSNGEADGKETGAVPYFPPYSTAACDGDLPVPAAESGKADCPASLVEAPAPDNPAVPPFSPDVPSSDSLPSPSFSSDTPLSGSPSQGPSPSKSLPISFLSATVKGNSAKPVPLSSSLDSGDGETPGISGSGETERQGSAAVEASLEREGGVKMLRPEEDSPAAVKGSLREEGRREGTFPSDGAADTDVSEEGVSRVSNLTKENGPVTARSFTTGEPSGQERNGRLSPGGTEGKNAGDASRTQENPSLTASGKTGGEMGKAEASQAREGGFSMEPKSLSEKAADGMELESARRNRPSVSSHDVTPVKVDSLQEGTSGKQGTVPARQVNGQELVDRIIEMRQTLGKNSGRVTITLDPPSLGALTLEVQVRDRRVETVLVAESFDVQQVLKGGLEQLRSALHQQGLKVDTLQVLWQDAPSDGGTGGSASHSFSHFFRERADSGGRTGNWLPGGKEESSSGGTGNLPPLYGGGRGEGISIFA